MGRDTGTIDLLSLAGIFIRRAWLLVVGGVVGGVAALLISSGETPLFEASATLLVEPSLTAAQVTAVDLQASQQLAKTYERLISTKPVLERASSQLNGEIGPGAIRAALSVRAVSGTQFVKVSARDVDPERAVRIADAAATAFIEQTREDRLADLAKFEEVASSQGISDISGFLSAQLGSLNSIRLVEQAEFPGTPTNPTSNTPVISGILLGLISGLVIVFALEYFSDPIPSPQRLQEILGVPTLGIVNTWGRNTVSENQLIFNIASTSMHAEQYRSLASNIVFAAAPAGAQVILITSALRNEGKTSTATNLAMALVERGKRVLLLDADLRKPGIALLISGNSNGADSAGLTQFLAGDSAAAGGSGAITEDLARPGDRQGLSVIQSGPPPPNPTSLLSSDRLPSLFDRLRAEYDVTLVDSPPVLAVADGAAIAPHADGIVFVIEANQTHLGQLRAAVRAIQHTGTPVLGFVINKVHKGGGRYGSFREYQYYTREYAQDYLPLNGVNLASQAHWYNRPTERVRTIGKRMNPWR